VNTIREGIYKEVFSIQGLADKLSLLDLRAVATLLPLLVNFDG